MRSQNTCLTFEDLRALSGRVEIKVRAVGWREFETLPAGSWVFVDAGGPHIRAYSPRTGRLCLYRPEIMELER